VTAGAGSGKTSVLVERILQRIMDREDPVEIDRLLVVTFTNAAAAEMKQRIGAALEKALQKNPRLAFLRRQLLLLNKAAISTVHSFCLQVIKRYYYLRDLDPSFRILEETEADLLQQEVLEEVLEAYYANEEAESPFYRLVDIYSSDRGDGALSALVMRLYSFSRSHLQPDLWLQKQAAAFAVEDAGELEKTPWVRETLLHCQGEIAGMLGRLQEALELAGRPEGPAPYIANLQEELAVLQQIGEAARHSWAELYEAMQLPVFGRLKPCRGENYSLFLKESVQQRRNECKKELQRLKEALFQRSLEEQAAELRSLAPLLQFLVEIVRVFAQRYRQAKEEKGALDFADLEHYALQILSLPDSAAGKLLPSAAALKYREQFVEVLVDEYQDINPVQEAILTLISLPQPGGNSFMVGDVKQSIYRFRLAAPELFLEKYHAYTTGVLPGTCLALMHNFRSRREILAGVNYLFRQIMDEVVGEMEYDREVWLHYGAAYPVDCPAKPPATEGEEETPDPRAVEVLFITHATVEAGEDVAGEESGGENSALTGTAGEAGSLSQEEMLATEETAEEELDRAALEGRLMARRIKELLGAGGKEPFDVFDRETGGTRPATYRDIVILLRAARHWAIPILEELRQAGIPVYAELGTGYFEATEVEVMLSLLKVIDNPYQEIPLAAVLRSPLVGLNAEELARIRAAAPRANYYEALQVYCSTEADHGPSALSARLSLFRQNLLRWQEEARQGSLAGLIWQIYRDTGYYDLTGGMPGGNQRQANLRALYDHARQYEATSLRGLFRFLRFIERLKERGGDLGVARALGEQEDVVRIITVHKSKGLEFPIVFVAGLSKQFNRQDLQRDFLLHKRLGFGPKYVDTALRLVYPTLPWLAINNRLNLELLAEEMRILYVALTRAREKLFLVATVKNIAAEVQRWAARSSSKEQLLPAYDRRRARSYLDWLGPALLRHPQAAVLRAMPGEPGSVPCLAEEEPSVWNVRIMTAREVAAEPEEAAQDSELQINRFAEVARLETVPTRSEKWAGEIARHLAWRYPYRAAESFFAKASVSELQKLFAAGMEGENAREAPWLELSLSGGPRPRFLGESRLTASERGTAYHTVMQHLQFSPPPDEANVSRQLEEMVRQEHLTVEEKETVDPAAIAAFFRTSLGERILQAARIRREIPFSLALPAAEVYPSWPGDENAKIPGTGTLPPGEEPVLIQGVIDCLAWEDDGLLLVDYKTDQTSGLTEEALRERYRLQLEYYARALETIWQERVKGRYLYFFNGQKIIAVEDPGAGKRL
jgi:ATP-dependent helicase/nuclease subunit A